MGSNDAVRDGIWPIEVPIGLARALPYTLCWVIADDRGKAHLVDPGMVTDDAWGALSEGLAELGFGIADVSSITVTHLHLDHLGLAARLREASGAPLALHAVEQQAIDGQDAAAGREAGKSGRWGVPAERVDEIEAALATRQAFPRVQADRLLAGGDVLEVPGRRLTVVATPGHTSGHLSIVAQDEGLVFTGDHILPITNPGLGLGGPIETNPIEDYLASLQAVVAAAPGAEVCPGHEHSFTGLEERVATLAAHHDARTAQLAAVLDELHGATVWDAASRLSWTGGWDGLHGTNLASALRQTEWHAERLGRLGELVLGAAPAAPDTAAPAGAAGGTSAADAAESGAAS